jgi:arylsulfatase A-like enzyme
MRSIKPVLNVFFVLLILSLLSSSCSIFSRLRGKDERAPSPMRIILIVVDTLRKDYISPYGAETPTTNVERLATYGQVFTESFSSFHQTTMSMASLFTGQTPSIESERHEETLPWTGRNWCGLSRFADPGGDTCVPQGLSTIAEDLREAGYWTVGVVSNNLLFRPYGYDQGFEDWIEVGIKKPFSDAWQTRTGNIVNRRVMEVLDQRQNEKLFLYVHYMDVHDWSMKSMPYTWAVLAFDQHLGELLDDLDKRGLLEDAVVILTSDHGEALKEKHVLPTTLSHYGNPSFEQVLQVPLIVAPASFANTAPLIRSEDVSDLIRQVAGIREDELIMNDTMQLQKDELYLSEMNYQTYRKGRWKSFWPRNSSRIYLVDLHADPQEMHDVADDHPEIIETHRKRVKRLNQALSSSLGHEDQLSEEDLDRLRTLGYVE